MNAPALRTEARQHQTITPRLQHAVRLLQLSSLDFAQEVQQAMGRNPFLEMDEPVDSADAAEGTDDDAVPGSEAPTLSDEAAGEAELEGAWERDSWQQTSTSVQSGSGDGEGVMEMVAADPGLRAHLHTQINVLPLSQRDHVLVAAIIESLDDDGYLRTELDELAALAELDPAVDPGEMTTALKLVQSLDPCGVGARSVCECLQLQLCCIDDEATRALAARILADHMDKLAQRDVPGLAKLLQRTPAEVVAACDAIRRFDPRPGLRFGASSVQFVTPDVIVKKVRGQWRAMLNSAVVPRVRLNQVYAELFQRHRDSKHAELANHLQEARWTVRNVEQRFSTILSVAEAILKRQHHFLEFGPLAMKPMGLKEIAEEIGLHESTVCRVTNNKYIATPVGVFELKYFFSRAMPTANGGSASGTAIRGVVKELIEAENPANPLSDVDITRHLARQGLTVARRTITKYRQMLKVPPVEKRRKHV